MYINTSSRIFIQFNLLQDCCYTKCLYEITEYYYIDLILRNLAANWRSSSIIIKNKTEPTAQSEDAKIQSQYFSLKSNHFTLLYKIYTIKYIIRIVDLSSRV
ncbi:hypothetical protein AMJ74_00750 [candidate division WOR_3 bacterium SM1_77]|uniref:Uncharacterized protein n=1 Tax=candidate division WOR_3 bacterium SM1_77 TaxID=1703778 RepID=A0A0S8K3M8_UNCW3|nr:MAG: hypothetical protein AMJ74_00750 [candidate division WOR_3 bacterium SM1_77]